MIFFLTAFIFSDCLRVFVTSGSWKSHCGQIIHCVTAFTIVTEFRSFAEEVGHRRRGFFAFMTPCLLAAAIVCLYSIKSVICLRIWRIVDFSWIQVSRINYGRFEIFFPPNLSMCWFGIDLQSCVLLIFYSSSKLRFGWRKQWGTFCFKPRVLNRIINTCDLCQSRFGMGPFIFNRTWFAADHVLQ